MGVGARTVCLFLGLLLGACGPGRKAVTESPKPVPPSPQASPSPSPPPLLQGAPTLEKVGTFEQPVFVTAPPGDPRLFVVEQTGKVKVVSDGQVLPQPFLDISGEVTRGYEQGLLSMAFDPDHGKSGLVYVSYTDRDGDSRIVEYKVGSDRNLADTSTRREVLFVDQPYANHNGGLVLFDPGKMLIVGFGDGGSGNDPEDRAQNKGELLGKLLRIDPRAASEGKGYSIPRDNPRAEGTRPEILALGLRNPWRFSYDESGRLWVGDVGQKSQEEVNVVAPEALPGANFGWPGFEGSRRQSGRSVDTARLIGPVHTYPTSEGCAVTGGYVYRGRVAALRGLYIFADHCKGVLESLRLEGSKVVEHKTYPDLKLDRISSFGEDSKGELYVTSLGGDVFRISATAAA